MGMYGRILTSKTTTTTPVKGLPEGLKFQEPEEKNYLKLHKCPDGGEAYSAAYLTTREHLLEQYTGFNTSMVNCEMASFIMMYRKRNFPENGTVVMSLDVLDWGVIHLSAFERLQRRWQTVIGQPKDGIAPVLYTKEYLRNISTALDRDQRDTQKPYMKSTSTTAAAAAAAAATTTKGRRKLENDWTTNTSIIPPVDTTSLASLSRSVSEPRIDRTVAIMPFLGFANGAGHSKLNNRFEYLQTCLWSVSMHFRYIVIFVKSEKDRHWVQEISGLPFWRVVMLDGLPKHAALPVSSVQYTKLMMRSGRWDFDYLYFTESDQILLSRIPGTLFDHLDKHPRRMILPHRLMPYPPEVLDTLYGRSLGPMQLHELQSNPSLNIAWERESCCLKRNACRGRQDFIHISEGAIVGESSAYKKHMKWKEERARQRAMGKNKGKPPPPAAPPTPAKAKATVRDTSLPTEVPVRNIYGLSVPLGNTNFFQETYRACRMSAMREVCP